MRHVVWMGLAVLVVMASGCSDPERWLTELACDWGDMGSCNNVALMHVKGEGGAKDSEAAVELYEAACDADLGVSCSNLSTMVSGGDGVAKDAARATRLAVKACELGYAKGCRSAGVYYATGEGVEEDVAQAADYLCSRVRWSGQPRLL